MKTKCTPQGKLGTKFLNDVRGSTGVILGIMMIPLTICVGMAVDYGRSLNVQSEFQTATDAAALAAANFEKENGNPSEDNSDGYADHMAQRKALVDKILSANLGTVSELSNWESQVRADQDGITVSISSDIDTSLTALVADKMVVQSASTAATLDGSAPLCILGLNSAAPDTVRFWGTSELAADGCAVHSNSENASSLVTGGNARAEADQFCTSGESSGSGFTPEPKTGCAPLADPYADLYTPTALSGQGITLYAGCNEQSKLRARNDLTISPISATQGYSFCGGVQVQAGATLTFQPGLYVIFNEFSIMAGATVDAAPGVTFYFAGPSMVSGVQEGYLTVQGGGNLTLTAPTSGPLAGVAIVQPEVASYTGGTTPAITHTIIGGGTIDIVGNVYTPQAQVRITGNGTINGNSDYFSIVADFVELEGNGVLNFNAGSDAVSAGMPELASNGGSGGAYLVK